MKSKENPKNRESGYFLLVDFEEQETHLFHSKDKVESKLDKIVEDASGYSITDIQDQIKIFCVDGPVIAECKFTAGIQVHLPK